MLSENTPVNSTLTAWSSVWAVKKVEFKFSGIGILWYWFLIAPQSRGVRRKILQYHGDTRKLVLLTLRSSNSSYPPLDQSYMTLRALMAVFRNRTITQIVLVITGGMSTVETGRYHSMMSEVIIELNHLTSPMGYPCELLRPGALHWRGGLAYGPYSKCSDFRRPFYPPSVPYGIDWQEGDWNWIG